MKLNRYISILISLLIIAAMGTSCTTAKRCARFYPPQVTKIDSVKITVTERVRDTIFRIGQDSSMQRALIQCDSLGQVHIMQYLDYVAGSGRSSKPSVMIRDNVLIAKCTCDSVNIHAILKDRETVTDHTSQVTTIPPPVQVKFIPGWMWFFGISGMISWAVGVIMIIFALVKSKFKLWL